MSARVFILATCRRLELLPYTQLVFATLRTGFPTARVSVQGNALEDLALTSVAMDCAAADCEFVNGPATIHHLWVEQLCLHESEPFWICDTDVIFYQPVEWWCWDPAGSRGHMAGWRIPEWQDEFTGCVTRARLHTSLLYVDPARVRERLAAYEAGALADSPFVPKANLFYPLSLPFKQRPYFYDTCAMLYHAIGGWAFTPRQLDAYFHFNFGTISDLVFPRLKPETALAFQLGREQVLKDTGQGRGQWRAQMEYYARRPA